MSLKHWDLVNEFTLFQAACLAAGREPSEVTDVRDYPNVDVILEALNKACLEALKWAEWVTGPGLGNEPFRTTDLPSDALLKALDYCERRNQSFWDIEFSESDDPIIGRDTLSNWFSAKGFESAYVFSKQVPTTSSENPLAPENGKPTRTPTDRAHVSDKLAYLNQAATKFWAKADRDERSTHTDNATIVAWLIERGYSTTLAEKAATIIRPEWAPTGRKPEE